MPGLLFHARVQMQVITALRRKGHGFFEARQLASTVDNKTIEMATAMAADVGEMSDAVGALGDGSFLKAIEDFLNSPLGKMLIDLIISLLTGA